MIPKVHVLELENASLSYQILYSPRRRTLGIEVYPDMHVLVRAPADCSMDEIQERLQLRAGWISKQLARFQRFSPRRPPRTYVSGETHLYLGRQYRLKVCEGAKSSVKLSRGRFCVFVPDVTDQRAIQASLDQWYLEHARQVFAQILDECFKRFARRGHSQPHLSVRSMKTRWGSLSPKGTMTLNINLIQAPKTCIEYVVFHELCHLEQKDHGPRFYRLLERMLPDWEQRKSRLEAALL